MTETRFDDLIARVDDLHRMSEQEAKKFVNEVYQDGIVSRHEADALFKLNEQIGGSDAHWDSRFREAIKDFLLTVEAPIGWVDEAECDWLIERISDTGSKTSDAQIDLLLDVLRYAEGAPKRLGAFALRSICDAAKADKRISESTVERVRRALYAPAGDGATWVTRDEAGMLFRLNDACAFARNDGSWNDLFARAIGNHLLASAHPDPMTEAEALAREKWLAEETKGVAGVFASAVSSLANGRWFSQVTHSEEKASAARIAAKEAALRQAEKVDSDEENWLLQRLGWDKSVSPAERALIDFLNREAPGFVSGLAAA
ncbi:MAG: hypothetical protein AAFV54_09190 [Pseudomonadota bacterium]